MEVYVVVDVWSSKVKEFLKEQGLALTKENVKRALGLLARKTPGEQAVKELFDILSKKKGGE